jgi:ATP-binding cassette subfamily B protein IrtB
MSPGRPGVVPTILRLAGGERPVLVRAIVLRGGQALAQAVPVGVLVAVVDRLRTGRVDTTGLVAATLTIAGAVVVQWALGYRANRLAWIATFAVFGRVRLRAVEQLRRLPLGARHHRRVGDTVTALTQDVNTVEVFTHEPLQIMVAAAVTPAAIVAFLAALDLALAAITAVSVAVALPVFAWANRRFAHLAATRQALQADASARMIEYVQGMPVVRSYGLAGERLAAFRDALDAYRRANTRLAVQLAPLVLAAVTVVELGVPLVVWLGGVRLLGGRLDSGTLAVALVLVVRVYQPLLQAVGATESLRLADASLDRIARLLDEPVQPVPATAAPAPASPPGITFEHVTFSYGDRPALQDVSFTAPARSMTAIVGPSGAGKTTILNLAARFWDADAGAVRLGGTDVRDLTPEALFRSVTMVFQDVYLFPGTIADNIALGRPDAAPAEIEAAARGAQAHDFIAALPRGYDTPVAEAGGSLSGGERQRLSVARAILKDAPVMLLDEATASIDPTSERLVQQALAILARDRTLLVVAHRLATITAADQILVVDRGRIVERGHHDELVAAGGLYQHLWERRRQAAAWRLHTS